MRFEDFESFHSLNEAGPIPKDAAGKTMVLLSKAMQEAIDEDDSAEGAEQDLVAYTKTSGGRRTILNSFPYTRSDDASTRKRLEEMRNVEYVGPDKGLSKRHAEPYSMVIDREADRHNMLYYIVPDRFLVSPDDLDSRMRRLWDEDPTLVNEEMVHHIAGLMAIAEKVGSEIWVKDDTEELLDSIRMGETDWVGVRIWSWTVRWRSNGVYRFYNRAQGEKYIKELMRMYKEYDDSKFPIPTGNRITSTQDFDRYTRNKELEIINNWEKDEDSWYDEDETAMKISMGVIDNVVSMFGATSLVEKHEKAAGELLQKWTRRGSAKDLGLL